MSAVPHGTRTLEVDGAGLAYDVRGPLPTADGRAPLVLIGQPMSAEGFTTLAAAFTDRTVLTYDPRGIGRSVRSDGGTQHDPDVAAGDLHALVTAVDCGPVEVFASSGGAVNALAWITAHPDDVATLVAHEPPLLRVLEDRESAQAAERAVQEQYRIGGFGAGMAAFIGMTSWSGPFTSDYLARPHADPAAFGMPPDDGSRDDPLLSGVSNAVTAYEPDLEALTRTPVRLVVAAGEESVSGSLVTGRTASALADALGLPLTVFPGGHAGFLGGEFGQHGRPEEFAVRLREVLASG